MTVYIYPNLKKNNALECTKEACEVLHNNGIKILMHCNCKEQIDIDYIEYISNDERLEECEFIICVGGDGTILRAAALAIKYDCAVLGINCGRLGFMSSLERADVYRLCDLCSRNFTVESRMMLDVIITRADGTCITSQALNDAVISHGVTSRIQDFTVLADGVVISSLRADGLIFSTPTGSSAYSLSAGGPLIEPTIDCIEFTQICPHSLFSRTMLISPKRVIEVKYNADEGSQIAVSVDGRAPIVLKPLDRLFIKKSEYSVKFIDMNANNYFNSIGKKLMQPTKEV
ncbi:MAG: NAD(+)/NADH kinase [Oscillospiraceae bacterium]|nr:NAD(+)/NADH kinase [Oscillospiraceae bacterium]